MSFSWLNDSKPEPEESAPKIGNAESHPHKPELVEISSAISSPPPPPEQKFRIEEPKVEQLEGRQIIRRRLRVSPVLWFGLTVIALILKIENYNKIYIAYKI